jgi:hypothetical protein
MTDHGEWRCPCPIHGGQRDSFAIASDTGQWYCHSECGRGGDIIALELALHGGSFLEAKRRVYELIGAPALAPKVEPITRRRRPEHLKPVKYYAYLNSDRTLKYEVIRYEGINPETGLREKDFGSRQPDREAGKWIYREPPDSEKLLYRLPDWQTSPHVLIVEGEKDADSLWRLGLPATSAMGGCKRRWLPQYTAALNGKRVAVFQDNDEPGRIRAESVCTALHAAGVYVKLLPPVPRGKDITDWICGDSENGIPGATKAEIFEFVRQAPLYTPPERPPVAPAVAPPTHVDIDDAIARHDLQAIYRMMASIAQLPTAELLALKARLAKEFGREFSKADFKLALKAAQAQRRADQGQDRAGGPLPTIVANGRPIRDVTLDALKALRAGNQPPVLFVRSGEPVYLWRDERDRPFVRAATPDHIRGRLDRSANFVRATEDGDKPIPVPIEVVRDVGALPTEQLGLPPLTAVVEAPTFRPDGTVIDQPGYDTRTGMYYAQSALEIKPVAERPDGDDIRAALDMIDDAICDFPFVDQASRANLLGLMLTLVLRPAISSCVPLALIDAPDFGTGKTFLVDLASIIATGSRCSMTPWPPNEEEMRKQIAASLLAGRPIICIDNVEGIVSSMSLALALTADEYETRMLGFSHNIRVPNRAVWIATGNNIRPGGDLPRRCYRIRMDAGTPEPYRSRTFRHPDLLGWASDHRGQLLHALLTISRAWFAAGQPNHVARPLGSFGDWHRIVGSILAHAGVQDFLANFDDTQALDEEVIQWEAFLLALADRYGDRPFTVIDLVGRIRTGDETLKLALPDYLAEAFAKNAESLKLKLGNAFARRRDRKFGEMGAQIVRLRRENVQSEFGRARVFEWAVRLAKARASELKPGPPS